jgi:hypothetical protein
MDSKKIIKVVVVAVFAGLLGSVVYGTLPGINHTGRLSSRSQLALVGQAGTFCTGYGDERDYLYNPDVVISTNSNGKETFTATRRSDGKVMRQSFSNEQFYVDRSSGALNISYDVVEKCGGVDITYTISNPTGTAQNAPDFRVEGIMQRTSGDFYLLDPRDAGYLRNIKKSDGSITNIFLGSAGRENQENWGALTYPDFYYSPVVVAHDTDFVAGSAFEYPYLQYKHEIVPQLTKVTSGLQAGTWRHEYKELAPATYARVPAGQTRTYTISLRFTHPQFWIFTLESYKRFFKQTYGNVDQVRPIDRRPVQGYGLVSELVYDSVTNPRSFRTDGFYGTLITEGWVTAVDRFIQDMQLHGFERSMLWAPSGLFSYNIDCLAPHNPPGFDGQGCNYPPTFMDFPTQLENTESELERFGDENIELGFWWGNVSHIPVPLGWDPPLMIDADYSNPNHVNFLNGQLDLAYERGAKIIGLDAFSGTTFERYDRIDVMKQRTNEEILFLHEGSGSDILHRKIANVVFNPPQYSNWWTQFDKSNLTGPDVLSRYINDGSEVWFIHGEPPFCGESEIERISGWGFTSLYYGYCSGLYPIFVQNLDLDLVTCFDGQDNDRDGMGDWPYDLGCESPMDTDERNSSGLDSGGFTGVDGDVPGPSDGETDESPDPNTATYGSSGSRMALRRRVQELTALLNSLIAQRAANPVPVATSLPVSSTPPRPAVSTPVIPSGTAPKVPSEAKWEPAKLFSRDLDVGSTGSDVTSLQQFLVRRNLLVMTSSSAYGTYGPMTRDAVARFQYLSGVPVTGVFDAATRARINQF